MRPLCTQDVLREEAKAVFGTDLSNEADTSLYRRLNALDAAALCLSGGGIRSAAFALGVIQALAGHTRPGSGTCSKPTPEKSLLAQFHYLSTVSGGGYIGSWISAWRARTDFRTVWTNLTGRPQGPDREPDTVGWLRSYSSYLTPTRGVLSADAWATVALYIGNLTVNWLIILPFVCFAILSLKIAAWLLVWLTLEKVWALQIPIAMVGAFGLIMATAFATRHRPSLQPQDLETEEQAKGASARDFLRGYLIWSLLSAIMLTQFLGSDLIGENFIKTIPNYIPNGPAYKPVVVHGTHILLLNEWILIGAGAAVGACIFAIGWWAGRPQQRARSDFRSWVASGFVYGALISVGFYLYLLIPDEEAMPTSAITWLIRNPVMYLLIGIPWCLISQFIAHIIFSALSSYRDQSDVDWEWLARAGGWNLVTSVALFVVTLLIFPNIQDSDLVSSLDVILPIGIGTALVVAIIGKSSISPGRGQVTGFLQMAANIVLALAAPVFVATLILVLSVALDKAIFGSSGNTLFEKSFPMANNIRDPEIWLSLVKLILAAGICFLIGLYASRHFNINRFSLHAIYRDRLIRAFLGASSQQRRPDRFIDLDTNDNPRIHTLWPPKAGTGWQPFHLINMTLNIVSSRRLAWQERKAASFTVSPLHSGSGGGICDKTPDLADAIGAYRPSVEYGGRGDPRDRSGISLGTAMAISGAAASPNMGYHSSPAITLLMTMFNVRLGWWLGNPGAQGKDTYFRDGPKTAISPLLRETFGLTTDDWEYVYLSDGGHFENLGLYEMVRRRCRSIIVVDAGCDPHFRFEDLGNAVRKIQIDLGVTIRFEHLKALRCRPIDGRDIGADCDYHTIGEIEYQAADGGGENGLILYVKPSYHGIEDAGIRSFASSNRDFPHQSTTNQWFGESQFESYRALGHEIMVRVLNEALSAKSCPPEASLRDILLALHERQNKLSGTKSGQSSSARADG
jgi:hypothetical protein